ncbi:SKAP protein, partial [Crocuta crocuta]
GGSKYVGREIINLRQENGQVEAADAPIRRNIQKSCKRLSKQNERKNKSQLLDAITKHLHQKSTETREELKGLMQ